MGKTLSLHCLCSCWFYGEAVNQSLSVTQSLMQLLLTPLTLSLIQHAESTGCLNYQVSLYFSLSELLDIRALRLTPHYWVESWDSSLQEASLRGVQTGRGTGPTGWFTATLPCYESVWCDSLHYSRRKNKVLYSTLIPDAS